jgi:hypothetical protein
VALDAIAGLSPGEGAAALGPEAARCDPQRLLSCASDRFEEPWEHSATIIGPEELAEIESALQPGTVLAASEGHRRTLRVCRQLVDALRAQRAACARGRGDDDDDRATRLRWAIDAAKSELLSSAVAHRDRIDNIGGSHDLVLVQAVTAYISAREKRAALCRHRNAMAVSGSPDGLYTEYYCESCDSYYLVKNNLTADDSDTI